MTVPKEPYFFSHDDVWSRGWGWYESLFQSAGTARAVGEGSTTYTQRFLYPLAAERIAQYLPDVKLIYLVRNPIERIESQWMHNRSRGSREPLAFNDAVHSKPQYIDNSLYMKQIDVYRQWFSDEMILVAFFEDFARDPQGVLKRVFEFLGLDPDVELIDPERPRHQSKALRVDRPGVSLLRMLPGFDVLRNAAPTWVRTPLRHVLKQGIRDRPKWDEATRAWAVGQLAADSHAFLSRYSETGDRWNL